MAQDPSLELESTPECAKQITINFSRKSKAEIIEYLKANEPNLVDELKDLTLRTLRKKMKDLVKVRNAGRARMYEIFNQHREKAINDDSANNEEKTDENQDAGEEKTQQQKEIELNDILNQSGFGRVHRQQRSRGRTTV